jgi:hypothetical protein
MIGVVPAIERLKEASNDIIVLEGSKIIVGPGGRMSIALDWLS